MKNIFIILFIFILSGTVQSQQKYTSINIDSVTVKNSDLLIILDSLIPKMHKCKYYETYNLVLIDIMQGKRI